MRQTQQGFSLVELSIVLVILGLLVGGVLSGQSLIRASELRAVTAEFQRYQTATQSFRDKYFALPGDMPNATQFWGRQTSAASCVSNSAAAVNASGTCDGSGEGRVAAASAASATGEMFQFWRQLALSGLVEGTYSGNAGTGGTTHSLIRTNVPVSKFSNAGWGAYYTGVLAAGPNTYALDWGNELFIGAASASSFNTGALFIPEDAWNIDTKNDDGRPGTGTTIAFDSVGFGSATSCTTSTSGTDYNGGYNLANRAAACSIFFVRLF